jgi:hypothetical protein
MNERVRRDGLISILFLQPLRGTRGWTIYALLLGLLGVVYFSLASSLVATTNTDLEASDQRSNIELAYASANDWFPHRSSYIEPLWPWLSRVVMDEDMGVYFTRGRWLNLVLGYAVTVLCAALAAWWMAPVPGLVAGVLTGIGVMLQRAHFFNPEPLLYALFTATVIFMALSLWRSRWVYYLAWGLFFGLANLTKGSMGPLLVLYAGATVVLLTIRAGWWPRWVVAAGAGESWSLKRHVAGTAAALLIIAGLMAPGAVYKNRVHGDPLYSPFKYYMWVEDFENGVLVVTPRIETAEGRASFAPGELPTAGNYLRKHGWEHAGERLSRGVREMSWRFLVPGNKANRSLRWGMLKNSGSENAPRYYWRFLLPARGLYLVWLALLVLTLLVVRYWKEGPPVLRSGSALAVLSFAAAAVVAYMLGFGWYAPIVGWRGERFTLMLYLPLLCGLLWSGHLLVRDAAVRACRYVYAAGLSILLLHAVVQIALLVAYPYFMPGF